MMATSFQVPASVLWRVQFRKRGRGRTHQWFIAYEGDSERTAKRTYDWWRRNLCQGEVQMHGFDRPGRV